MNKENIMKNLAHIAAISAAALLASGAQAAVSSEQLNAASAGMSEQQVIALLGKPDSAPHWANGTHSLVYELKNDSQAKAYVDINNASGKLVSRTILRND